MSKSPHLTGKFRRLLTASLVVSAVCAAPPANDGQRWWSYVKYLADDQLEGRNTGSEGHRKAATYVAGEFERAGLKVAGTDGYLQQVKFRTRRIEEKGSSVELVRKGTLERATLGDDLILTARIDPAPSLEAGLVFVGYGLTEIGRAHV